MEIKIRLEEKKDYQIVEVLTREAFWNLYRPGCDEHYLVHTMRNSPDFMPDLALVAEIDGQIAGCIMFTKSYLVNEKNEKIETATFGPLCVHPDFQRKGIGTALIEHSKKIVSQKGYPAIIILGDPHNYCKHGFKTGRDYGVSMPDGKFPLGLLVLELQKGFFNSQKWKLHLSDAYDLDQQKVEEFDLLFAAKEKKHQYSQDLFYMLVRSVVE